MQTPKTPEEKLKAESIACWFVLMLSAVGLGIGPFAAYQGASDLQHQRPSLHWPTVDGTMMRSEVWYSARRHDAHVRAMYSYQVDGQRYVSHQVALWNPDLGDGAENFVAEHPAKSTVTVHYDPQHPANAVLVPGADETVAWLRVGGGAVLVPMGLLGLFRMFRHLTRVRAKLEEFRRSQPARSSAPRVEEETEGEGLPEGFLSYEPAMKRKLNCLPDKDCLGDVLGQNGDKLQEWKPDDRMIDAKGRVHRVVFRPDKGNYDLEPLAETWDYLKLLDLAVADAKLIGCDWSALERRVEAASPENKIPVLMQCVDEFPSGPRWFLFAFFGFLLLFAAGVFYGAYQLITWLQR